MLQRSGLSTGGAETRTGVLGYSQLDVQEEPLLLADVDPPDAVLPLRVGLRPVGRQDHPGHGRQLPPAHGCGARGRQGSAGGPGVLMPTAQHRPAARGPTSAQRLRVVPVRVPHVDALDDGGALLQGVPGVARELHGGPQVVGGVGGGEVPVLDVGLVAVAPLEGWKRNPPSAVGARGRLGGPLPSPALHPLRSGGSLDEPRALLLSPARNPSLHPRRARGGLFHGVFYRQLGSARVHLSRAMRA